MWFLRTNSECSGCFCFENCTLLVWTGDLFWQDCTNWQESSLLLSASVSWSQFSLECENICRQAPESSAECVDVAILCIILEAQFLLIKQVMDRLGDFRDAHFRWFEEKLIHGILKGDWCGWMDTLGGRWPALSDRMDAPASPSCIWRNSASLEHCARSQRAISQVCAVMNRKASDLEIRSLLLIEKFWNKSYNIYVSQGEPQILVNEKGKFFLSVNFPWQQFLATHLSLLDDHGDHRQE